MSDVLRSLFTAAMIAALAAACGGGPVGDGRDDDDDDRPDGGFTDPGGGDANPTSCATDVVDMPTTAACAAATRTCLEACTTDECPDTCLAADPAPDACGACLEDGWIACSNSMGCQAQWDVAICCYEGCADPESAACDTTCASDFAAFETCAEAYDEACAASTDAICFMP